MRRPAIHPRALYAIAKAVILDDPTIDDHEWRERIKWRLLDQGWRYPILLEQIGQAMTQVERTVKREQLARRG